MRLPALKAEAKAVKAMKTPAARSNQAKGMKPDTKTMKAMKTPAAKAKGMKLKTNTTKVMKTPAAKAKGVEPKTEAKHMKPETATEIIINGPEITRLTTLMSPCEILRRLLPPRRRVSVWSDRARCA